MSTDVSQRDRLCFFKFKEAVMKKFKAIILILIALSLTVSFVSCTKDNNPDTELPIADTEQTPNDNSNDSEALVYETITLEKVKKIIAENETFDQMVEALVKSNVKDRFDDGKRICYWLDNEGNKCVIISLIDGEIIYVETLRDPSKKLYKPEEEQDKADIEQITNDNTDLDSAVSERMTLEEVKKIIADNDTYEKILNALRERQSPDYGYGSGVTITEWWLDEEENKKIINILEQGQIYYNEILYALTQTK